MSVMKTVLALFLAGAVAACGGGESSQTEPANGAAAATGNRGGGESRTIAAGAAAAPELSTFMQLVESAGLTETLQSVGPYTVFVPVNDAFAALPEDVRAGLAQPEQREQLLALLSHHIVPGAVTTEDLARAIERGEDGRVELATVAGDNLSIARQGETITILNGEGAPVRIVSGGQIQSNGIIHRVDGIIMPPSN